jgi:molybdopterin-guanine dinucleotide biosynthesis protein A
MDINMTGIILAGGKNSRINTNKAMLKVGEEEIIRGIINKFMKLFNNIIIVTNNKRKYEFSGIRIVEDVIPDSGSLGGLYSGLVNSSENYNFIVACDMPFINERLVAYMVENCRKYEVLVPKTANGYEPLHAIYSKRCIKRIKDQLEKENLKITDFYKKVIVKEIKENIVRKYDLNLLSFFNINTNDEYHRALNIVSSQNT